MQCTCTRQGEEIELAQLFIVVVVSLLIAKVFLVVVSARNSNNKQRPSRATRLWSSCLRSER